MGPIMGNLGNLQYILLAVIGGALAIGGVGGLTLGSIVAFLQLSRSFSMPISQISQQVNTIVIRHGRRTAGVPAAWMSPARRTKAT